jgi:uncharacterized membrane protein
MNYYLKNKNRIWQIDFARGIAVIAMVALNAVILFSFFDLIDTDITLLMVPAMITASIFIFLAGISLVLSNRKHKDLKHSIMRGAKVFAYGLIITVVSWFVASNYTVWFGILQLIGLSIIISSFLIKFKKLNLLIGSLVVIIGVLIQNIIVDTPLLIWLGIKYAGFQTLDYFPIFPWLGIMLIGAAFGNILFYRKIKMGVPECICTRAISFLGRNSLIIYFLHVIIILIMVEILRYL